MGDLVSRKGSDLTLLYESGTNSKENDITYKQKQFGSPSLEMDECLCSVKDSVIFSYALEKNPTSFSGFSPDAIKVTTGNVLPGIFILV